MSNHRPHRRTPSGRLGQAVVLTAAVAAIAIGVFRRRAMRRSHAEFEATYGSTGGP